MTLSDVGQTISATAKVIPEGWEIDVRIIRGAVCVSLYDEIGEKVDFATNWEWWAEDIECACEYAIKNATTRAV